jgi:hypothetical protein
MSGKTLSMGLLWLIMWRVGQRKKLHYSRGLVGKSMDLCMVVVILLLGNYINQRKKNKQLIIGVAGFLN